jgi:1-acyl-sn-glycerol-3-phosphate acyltransferase
MLAPALRSGETFVRTAVGVVLLPFGIGLGSALAFVLAILGAPTWRLDWIYVACARLCRLVAGTRLLVDVSPRFDPARAYVVVANHESVWDPVCLVEVLRSLTLRFVAKQEIMRLPVFGHALRVTGNVAVVRNATAHDVAEIRRTMDARAPGTSILFFAEGTRSRDGALHAFKRGAFVTALGYGLPILPVGIAGTYAIWPKGRLRLRRAPVALVVGEPIATDGLSYDDRDSLRRRTFDAVAALRTAARARLRAAGFEPGGVD